LEIEAALNAQVEKGAQVVIFNGGTGISKRDGTYDTVRRLFCTEIPGFGEIFRYLSFQQIGTAAMLSRATAGIYKDVLVFLTPGSPKAVQLAWKGLISKEIRHMVWEINR
jgi:molybdenum cofactor biosynthesis protein B